MNPLLHAALPRCWWVRTFLSLIFLGLCLAPASAQMDIFIRFTGTNGYLPGTSTDARFRGSDGWSNIDAISLGAVNESGSRTTFIECSVDNSLNSKSPAIFEALAAGRTFQLVEVALRKAAGGQSLAYLNYDFKPVHFLGQNWTATTGDTGARETIRMSYSVMRIRYRPQNFDGTLGTEIVGQWNLLSGKAEF